MRLWSMVRIRLNDYLTALMGVDISVAFIGSVKAKDDLQGGKSAYNPLDGSHSKGCRHVQHV